MHPIVSLSWCFAPLTQQRNGLGEKEVLVRGWVVLLVPQMGKKDWRIASVIINTEWFYTPKSGEVMKM